MGMLMMVMYGTKDTESGLCTLLKVPKLFCGPKAGDNRGRDANMLGNRKHHETWEQKERTSFATKVLGNPDLLLWHAQAKGDVRSCILFPSYGHAGSCSEFPYPITLTTRTSERLTLIVWTERYSTAAEIHSHAVRLRRLLRDSPAGISTAAA